jgi:hypothetical protein
MAALLPGEMVVCLRKVSRRDFDGQQAGLGKAAAWLPQSKVCHYDNSSESLSTASRAGLIFACCASVAGRMGMRGKPESTPCSDCA